MVQDRKEVGPIVLDDRITLPPREKMDPETRRMYEESTARVLKRFRKRKKATAAGF